MSLLSDLASKLLGASTTDEYLKKNLAIFCNANKLQNLEFEHCYKLDKSRTNPRLNIQVHFCSATLNGKIVSVVIAYDEDMGSTIGSVVDNKSSLMHRLYARSYKSGGTYNSSFYRYVINEADEVTELKG